MSAIINSETNEKFSPTDNHDLQLETSCIQVPDKLSLHEKDDLNSHSSLIQMPGSNSGDGMPHKSSQNSEEPLLLPHTSSLPTQVGINKSGTVHTDFPFDGNTLSLKEKQALSGNTLLPPKKRLVNTSGDTCTSGEPSYIFRQKAAETLAKDLVSMAVGSDNDENNNDYNASAELYSDASSQQLVTSNPSEGPTIGSKLFPVGMTQSREIFPEDTSKDTSTGSDNKNITQVNISLNDRSTLEDPADKETSQDVNTTVVDSKQDASNEETAVGGDSKQR